MHLTDILVLLQNCHLIFQTKNQDAKSAHETKHFTGKLSWKKKMITSIYQGGKKEMVFVNS